MSRRPLRHRLTFRFSVAFCVGAGVLFAGVEAWTLSVHREQLTRLVETQATELAEVVRRSTRDAMMRNDPGQVRSILETVASQQPIERIRVFDKQGRISKSTERTEVGKLVDIGAEQCISCHQAGRPLVHLERADRARIFVGVAGGRVLAVIAPIQNEASCATADCHAHSPQQSLLGVLDVQMSLSGVDRELALQERRMAASLALSGLALLALAWLLTWRMILVPVERLTEATAEVSAHDLAHQVPVRSRDELGRLASAWNAMIARLGEAQREVEAWGQRLEEKVAAKTRELEEAHRQILAVERMASLGRLAAVVAHELNNPLAGIATYARLLGKRVAREREGGGAPEAANAGRDPAEILRLIEEESRRCGNIVRNLLLFSRDSRAELAAEELWPLLERAVLLVQHKADLQEVRLELEVPKELPRLRCDASQVEQLVLALLMNGIEATPAGGSVTVAATAEAGGVVLRVADTGRGIPPEHLDRIFEPFFSTKESGTGVGLGLAVVYGIVSRHGGRVEVDSRPGAGTTFTVRLPWSGPPLAAEKSAGRESL